MEHATRVVRPVLSNDVTSLQQPSPQEDTPLNQLKIDFNLPHATVQRCEDSCAKGGSSNHRTTPYATP
jgi:hypothetical protein